MTHEAAVNTLMCRYKEIYKRKGNSPDWATKKVNDNGLVHPPIPFVGKQYFEQPVKILLYASAENLNEYDGYIDDDSIAIDRHRYYFESSKSSDYEFPSVHIQPINNGALLLCACHIMSRLSDVPICTPADFLEKISCANYGKYTIKNNIPNEKKINKDYASNSAKLNESQEYIEADIEILHPDYIIMVKTMYEGTGNQKEFIDSIKGDATIIPIPQINGTTVNTLKAFRESKMAALEELHPAINLWYPNLKSVSHKNFMRVFSYLDNIMSKLNI